MSREGLKRRIATTRTLRSIVRTMKTLSAVSISQYDRASLSIGRSLAVVEDALAVLLRQPGRTWQDASSGPAGTRLTILVGSDHGLCGRFNEDVLDESRQLIDAGARPAVVAVGARIGALLESRSVAPNETLFQAATAEALARVAERLVVAIDTHCPDPAHARVMIIGNRRTSDGRRAPQASQLLPLDPSYLRGLAERPWKARGLPILTAPATALFPALVRQLLFVRLFRVVADSQAAEHAARLSAMQAAERNIDASLEEMERTANMQRQDQITDELIDLVSATAASS